MYRMSNYWWLILLFTVLCSQSQAQYELNLWPGPAIAGSIGGNILSVTHEFTTLPEATANIDGVTYTFRIGSLIKTSLPSRWYLCAGTNPISWVPASQYFAGNVGDATFADQLGNYPVPKVDPAFQYLANLIKDITATVSPTTVPDGREAILGGYSTFRIFHGLNTTHVLISVYQVSDGGEVFPLKYVLDNNTVIIQFGKAFPVASFRCVITKTGQYGYNQTISESKFQINHGLTNPVIFRVADSASKSEYPTNTFLAQLVGDSSIELTFGSPQPYNSIQLAVAEPRNKASGYSIGSSTSPSAVWTFNPILEERTPIVVVYDKNWNLADPLITTTTGTITVTFGRPVDEDGAYTMFYCYNTDLYSGQWIDIPGNNWDFVDRGTLHGRWWVPFDMDDLNVYGGYIQHSQTPDDVAEGDQDTTLHFYNDLTQWVIASSNATDLSLGASSGEVNLLNDPTVNWLSAGEGDKLNLWGGTYKIGIEQYAMRFTSERYFRFYPYDLTFTEGLPAFQIDFYGNSSTYGFFQSGDDITSGRDMISTGIYKFKTDSVSNKLDFGTFADKNYSIGLESLSMKFLTDQYFAFRSAAWNATTNPAAQLVMDASLGQMNVNRLKFQRTYTTGDVTNPAYQFSPNEMFMSSDGEIAYTEANMDISTVRSYTASEIIASSTLMDSELFYYLPYTVPVTGEQRYAQFACRVK